MNRTILTNIIAVALGLACSADPSATYPSGQVRIGTGTFAYPGAASETSRALVIAADASNDVATVDVATSLAISGGFSSVTGNLAKAGAGTLALGQPDAGVYAMATDTNSLDVCEGTLALESADGATNLFCTAWNDSVSDCEGVTRVGVAGEGGVDRAARLDIAGGYNHFGEYLLIDNGNGMSSAVNSSVNLYGGTLLATRVHVGDCGGEAMASRPELNIYGGTAKVRYLRIANSRGAKGRVNVAGGRLEMQGGIYCASNGGGESLEDALLPDAELNISDGGYVSTGTFTPAHGGAVNLTVRIGSGGWLQLYGGYRNTEYARMVTVIGDGGTQASSSDTVFDNVWRIGGNGFTFHSDHVNTFTGTLENDCENPGTFTVSGNGTLKLFCSAPFSGEIAAVGTTALVLSNNSVSASCVTMADGALSAEGTDATVPHLRHAAGCPAHFAFTKSGGTVRRLNLTAWDMPGSVRITLSDFASGTDVLFTCPASCGLTADMITTERVASGNTSIQHDYSVSTANGITTVSVTSYWPSLDNTAKSWSNASGGGWSVGSNWSGSSAPDPSKWSMATFATGSAATDTAVTLNSTARLQELRFNSSPSYSIGGSGSIAMMKRGNEVAKVVCTVATNKVEVPMTYNGPLRIAVKQRAKLELASLSGGGDVQLNESASGAEAWNDNNGRGVCYVADASGLRGKLTASNGLLDIGSLGTGLAALTVGGGVFRYSGAEARSVNGPLTLAANDYSQSTIDIADGNATLTVRGPVSQTGGQFTKIGRGTLVLDGDGDSFVGTAGLHRYDFTLDPYSSWDNGYTADSSWPIDGGCSVRSFCGMLCGGGKTVWGKAGQTLTIRSKPDRECDLWIGSTTTATPAGEHDAEAEINGGSTVVANGGIVISRNHGNSNRGTADKETLLSRLTLNDGSLSAKTLYMPNNDWLLSKNDSQFIQNGGELVLSGSAEIGLKGAGGTATYTMNGGTATVGGAFRLSSGGATGPATTLNLNGGTLFVAGSFQAQYGVSTFNLNEGATLQAATLAAAGTSYDNTLNWNGGRFVCGNITTTTLQGFKAINIGAKGAWIDTSGMTAGNVAFKNLIASCDDALHVCGATPFRAVLFRDFTVNALPVVVEKSGSVLMFKEAGTNLSVTVRDGGYAGSVWTSAAGAASHVKNLTLGESAGDRPVLVLHHGSGFITPVRAWNSLDVNGTVEVALMDNGQTAFTATAFSNKTILIAPKGSIDASKFTFTGLTPSVGATFSVSSVDASYDQLVMTTTVTAGADSRTGHVWNTAGSGAWGDAANWTSAPTDEAGDKVSFPSTLADATVSLGGTRTLGAIASEASGIVKLTGGDLSVKSLSAEGRSVSVTDGTLVLPAMRVDAAGLVLSTSAGATQVVAGVISTPAPATAVQVNPSVGAGTVRFAARQGAQSFTSSSGTLEGPASAFGGGTITVKNSTLRITGGGFVESHVYDASQGLNLRTEEDIWFDGGVNVEGPFVKTGSGTAYIGGLGSFYLGRSARGPDDYATTAIPANGDLPASGLGTLSVAAGKLVLGLDDTQAVTVAGRIDIGQSIAEFDAAGKVLDSELEILGGTVTAGDLRIGHNAGAYRVTRDSGEKRRNLALTVRGGTLTFGNTYTPADSQGYFNGTSTLNLYGGTIKTTGQYFNLSQSRTTKNTEYGVSKTVINIYGGVFTNTVTELKQNPGGAYNIDINLYGGDFAWTAPFKFDGGQSGFSANIRMSGGTFAAPYVQRNYSGCSINFYWNGGTLRPTQDGASFKMNSHAWNSNVVSTNGAAFDIPGANAFTLNQAFTHDPVLGAEEDGGIIKRGTGTLVMDEANTFTGPCVVEAGVMIPMQADAVPGGIVLAGGTFDCNGFAFTVPCLKGAGGAAVNGTVAVAGTMAPLDAAMTNAPYATVDNLAFGEHAVVSCPPTQTDGAEEADAAWVAPYFRVTGSCTGLVKLDFGLDDDVKLPTGFRVKVAEYTSDVASFPAVTGINFGIVKRRYIGRETETDAVTGVTSVYAVLRPAGTIVSFR